MSLVTLCPACSTSFHISEEQLAARQGKVRCGNCQHVFNALQQIADTGQPVFAEAAQAVAPPPSDTPQPAAIAQPAPPAPADTPQPVDTPQAAAVTADIPSWQQPSSPKTVADAAGRDKLSRQAGGKRFPWVASLFSLLFLLLAMLQTAYFMRVEIAARWPVLKPYMLQACQPLNCSIPLPQDADQLVIDDSELEEDPEYQDLIHLHTTLINKASTLQAYPLLELTLTDARDNPLLRRDFKPADYLPAGIKQDRGMASNQQLRIKLSLAVSGEPIAGYRLFLKYR